MGFLGFGRKTRRETRTDAWGSNELAKEKMVQKQPVRSQTDTQTPPKTTNNPRKSKRESDKPNRLTKIDRTPPKANANAPGRRSATAPIAIPNARNGHRHRGRHETFPTPPANPFISPNEQVAQSDVYQHNPASQSSIGQDLFSTAQLPPTLNAKRSSQDAGFPRRRTSKRRAEDQAREHEIRSMSSPVAISKRASFPAGPLNRETKRISSGFNRHGDRTASEISLPIPDSIASSIDGLAEHQHSFKVNAFDMFSPRPTVRYTENPRYHPSRGARPSQSSTRPDKRPAIPEEDMSPRRRIDDLADDLDSTALRELMERDRKRKEKKRQIDQERLERRLQRRADRQREEEEQQTGGEPSSKRDVTSAAPAQPAGLGILSSETAQPEPDKGAESSLEKPHSSGSWLGDPSKENVSVENPFADDKAEAEAALAPPMPIPDRSFLRTDSPLDTRMSQSSVGTASPPRSPAQRPRERSSLSQMSGLAREWTPDTSERGPAGGSRRASEQNSAQMSTWSTFFKRGGSRRKRTPSERKKAPPSEFSNTSRESFGRQAAPPPSLPALNPARTFRRSSTPQRQRTQSKFREDLPDFPISPPDSRFQSPEAELPGNSRALDMLPEDTRKTPTPAATERQNEPGSEAQENAPSAVMTHSLASVDSEASWLSGRPAKRNSLPLSTSVRDTESPSQDRREALQEEDDLANDEYLSRLTPSPDDRRGSDVAARRASSTILNPPPANEEEPEVPPLPGAFVEEGTTWHGGVARQPTLVQQRDHYKSREGLLNDVSADSPEGDEQDSQLPTPFYEATTPPILQASRVEYGFGHRSHGRHISAGSAKLLDINRGSMDSSRRPSIQTPTSPKMPTEAPTASQSG